MHKLPTIVGLFVLLFACKTPQVIVKENKSQILVNSLDSLLVDSDMVRKIQPYKNKMDAEINQVIGTTEFLLVREKPEGTLCNLAADAVFDYALKHSTLKVDFSVLNYGGIRIASIGKGNITNGKLFEMMPFDNEIVLLQIKGYKVKELFKLIAENEGWPLSGATCELNNKESINIRINGISLQDSSIYTIATSDYLANGGDQTFCFKDPLNRMDLNYKVRNAIGEYVKEHSPLHLSIEGRITRKTENGNDNRK